MQLAQVGEVGLGVGRGLGIGVPVLGAAAIIVAFRRCRRTSRAALPA